MGFMVGAHGLQLMPSTKFYTSTLSSNRLPLCPFTFFVMIESLRSLIRPIRLSVRLVANIVAGHLLITLLSSSVRSKTRFRLLRVVILGLIILRGLETAVALIQAYVFSVLSTIYLREVNTQSIALVK